MDVWMYGKMDRETNGWTDSQVGGQTDRRTDRIGTYSCSGQV